MKYDGCYDRLTFFRCDDIAFGTQVLDGFFHQEHGSGGVLEPSMLCSGVDKRGHPQLLDACESLQVSVLKDFIQEPRRKIDEAENRIIDDFSLLHFILIESNNRPFLLVT